MWRLIHTSAIVTAVVTLARPPKPKRLPMTCDRNSCTEIHLANAPTLLPCDGGRDAIA